MDSNKRKWFSGNRVPVMTMSLLLAISSSLCMLPQSAFALQESALVETEGQNLSNRQRYDAAMQEWQGVYVDALKVFYEFRICEESEAEALQEQYLKLKAKGDLLAEKTAMAAVDCVEESTTPDPTLLKFLEPLTQQYYDMSRYAQSAKAGRAMRKHFKDDFPLMFHTIRSAFFANDFAYAGELFDEILSRPEWLDSEGKMAPELMQLYDTQESLLGMWKKEQQLREIETVKNHLPRICFETTKGPVIVELFEDQHPVIVNNLICLLELEENPFFTDFAIYFYLQHQFAMSGSKTDNGSQFVPLARISDEELENSRGNFHGSFSLDVQQDRDGKIVLSGCRFVQIPIPELNGNALVIGRVVEGMEIIAKFEKTHQLDEELAIQPVEAVVPDRVIRTTVVRKPEGKVYTPIPTAKNNDQPEKD